MIARKPNVSCKGIQEMRQHLITAVAAVALVIYLAVPQHAKAAEVVTISTSTETLDAFVPLLGAEIGTFSKYGIELRFVRAGMGGPAMVSAVVGGSADITHVASSQILPAIEKGADLTVLAGNYDIDYTLIAQKDAHLDLTKPYPAILTGLKGKVVGVAIRGGATEQYIRKLFADAGINPDKDVTLIAVGTGIAAAGAFINHQVDAMVNIPPSSTLVGRDRYDLVVDLNTTRTKVYDRNFLFTVFTANSDFVKNRPNVAQNFCRGIVDTIKYMKDPANNSKVIDFTAAKLNLSPAQAREVMDVYKSGFDARLTKDRWNGMKNYGFFVPDWSKHVYEPCVNITAQAS